MELIIAILFFSLSAAVCVQLFAASYRTSQQSTYRDTAMLQAQSMASLFTAADGDLTALLSYANATEVAVGTGQYAGTMLDDGVTYQISLLAETIAGGASMDASATAAEANTATVIASGSAATAGQRVLLTIAITPAQNTEPIVTLQTSVYLPLTIEQGA